MIKEKIKKEERPWGLFREFTKNEKSTVKILEIEKGEELSLQKHKNREELWYFLTEGIVQLGDKKIEMEEGESIKIPKEEPHRIIAKENKVKVIEISFGDFDEKDEIRLEDKYNRE